MSMGWHAARKLRRSVDGLARVLAVEILTAARALDLRARSSPPPPPAPSATCSAPRVGGPGPDRYLAPEIEAVVEAVLDGSVLAAAQSVTGELA